MASKSLIATVATTVLAVGLTAAPGQGKSQGKEAEIVMEVEVDDQYCFGSSAAPCVEMGTAGVEALPNVNDTLIMLFVTITKRGKPFTGLTQDHFWIDADPLLSSTFDIDLVNLFPCPSCFAEPFPGLYTMAVQPANATWLLSERRFMLALGDQPGGPLVANKVLREMFVIDVVPAP